MLFPATYISADALERADAYRLGYRTVCHHPREIGVPEVTETLVIDFNTVRFEDRATVVLLANKHARRGVLVGFHTYDLDALAAHPLAPLPNVIVAKTHRELLIELGRFVRRHGRLWLLGVHTVPPPDHSEAPTAEAEDEDLLLWLEAAQAECDGQQVVQPANPVKVK